MINQRGFKFGDERWGLTAVDIPLNMGLILNPNSSHIRIFVDGGLNTEYNTRAFTKIDGDLVKLTIGSSEDDIKPLALGFNLGTGLQFSESIKVRVNYYKGMTNLVRTEGDEWKNEVVGLSLNYFF